MQDEGRDARLRSRQREEQGRIATTSGEGVASTGNGSLTSHDLSLLPPSLSTTEASPSTPSRSRRHHHLLNPRTNRSKLFQARSSILDRESMESSMDRSFGWVTLFWILMFYYLVSTILNNHRQTGNLLGLSTFFKAMKDFQVLVVSDLCLVASTTLAWGLQKLVVTGWVKSRAVALVLQHVAQCVVLIGSIAWTVKRDWPWLQSGSFCAHTFAMMMKMHSYLSVNRRYDDRLGELRTIERRLAQEEKDAVKGEDVDHEREELEAWKEDLKHSLTKGGVTYPSNVTLLNFIDYLLCPTFVYELAYPRTPVIRWPYFFEKLLSTFLSLTLLYILLEHSVHPHLSNLSHITLFETLQHLLVPFLMTYLLIFYIIFECIANAFAEITRFADRHFYEDWWNARSFGEFAKKWNKPVHEFLTHHFYHPMTHHFHLHRRHAFYLTFLFSSSVHELLLIVISRRFYMYLFFFQMLQIPLIWLGERAWILKRPFLGNLVFWVGMFIGPPLIALLYCREHYIQR